MAHDEEFGQEWARLLFGEPISLLEPVSCRLAHRLAFSTYELSQWQLSIGAPCWLSWRLSSMSPLSDGATIPNQQWRTARRIVLSPDGCWPHVVHQRAAEACLAQGVALAWFDRLAFAHDPPSARKQGSFYAQFPHARNGCLGVWAWALSLNAQVLNQQMPGSRIGVIGHSRGGKAALLCAALDHRIDAVIANNSGTGGAASLAVADADSESLAQLVSTFPHWVSAEATDPAVQARLCEIDCMALWSRIAPRPLLILQAQQDAWANPLGTRHAGSMLKPYWPVTGAFALFEREGGHAMEVTDWHQAAVFMRQSHAGWV